jgi:hypothetical protein
MIKSDLVVKTSLKDSYRVSLSKNEGGVRQKINSLETKEINKYK